MIWVLAGATVLANVNLSIAIYLAYRERKSLISAMLHSSGQPDAARVLNHTETTTKLRKQVKKALKNEEDADAYSANNPFGVQKPLGV